MVMADKNVGDCIVFVPRKLYNLKRRNYLWIKKTKPIQ